MIPIPSAPPIPAALILPMMSFGLCACSSAYFAGSACMRLYSASRRARSFETASAFAFAYTSARGGKLPGMWDGSALFALATKASWASRSALPESTSFHSCSRLRRQAAFAFSDSWCAFTCCR
jgi:hypothetical protein